MASLQDMERGRVEREHREAAFRDYANKKYGGELGTAFCNYFYGNPRTEEEQKETEIVLARAISDKLDSQNSLDRALGVAAILESTRGIIAPVARQAMDASLRSMPIG